MELGQGTLREVLTGDRQFRIPLYQRPYSWQRPDWITLWIDVLTQYKVVAGIYSETPDLEERDTRLRTLPKHYLGALVQANPSAVGLTRVTVIDGQQRLSTATALLAALRDSIAYDMRRMKRPAEEVAAVFNRISRAYLTNDGYAEPDDSRLVLQEADQRALNYIRQRDQNNRRIDITAVGLATGESDLLLRAYNFFYAEMNRRRVPPSLVSRLERFASLFPLKLDILEAAIADRIYVITIEAGQRDDVNAIFESLNTKGRDLQQVDLLKNFLFLSLGGSANRVIANEWRPMERDLEPKELEHYVWAQTVASGENVLQKRTYETIQRQLPADDPVAVTSFVEELRRSAPYFKHLLHPSTEPDADIRAALADLEAAGGVTAIPLAFYAYRRRVQAGLSKDDLVDALRAIESFLVRRMLCGLLTNNLNSMFGSMLARLRQPQYAPTTSVSEDVSRLLFSKPSDFPTDDDLRERIPTTDFYHQQKPPQRLFVLRKLDSALNESGVVPDYELSVRSIEHIAPQNPGAISWLDELGSEQWSRLQDRYLHSLGNLTLLTPAENSALGDRPWTVKRVAYAASGYALTRHVAMNFSDDPWTEVQILERSEQLAHLAAQIWPRHEVPAHIVEAEPQLEGDDEPRAVDDSSAELEEDDELSDELLDPELWSIQRSEEEGLE